MAPKKKRVQKAIAMVQPVMTRASRRKIKTQENSEPKKPKGNLPKKKVTKKLITKGAKKEFPIKDPTAGNSSNEIFENFVGQITPHVTGIYVPAFIEDDSLQDEIKNEDEVRVMEVTDVQNVENDAREIIEQLENLEVNVQEEVVDMLNEEIIQFEQVENVVTVECITDDITSDSVSNDTIVQDAKELRVASPVPVEMEETPALIITAPVLLSTDDAKSVTPLQTVETVEERMSSMFPEESLEENTEVAFVTISDKSTLLDELCFVEESPLKGFSSLKDASPIKETNSIKDISLEKDNSVTKDSSSEKETNSARETKHERTKVRSSKKSTSSDFSKSKTQKKTESKREKKIKNEKSASTKQQEQQDQDDNLVRRSSRIKSISVLKKPSVGHGVVKSKSETDISENSNTDSEKSLVQSLTNLSSDTEHKPIKVKSRWRRSSELEMNVTLTSDNFKSSSSNDNSSLLQTVMEKSKLSVKDEIVEARLKQFVHLKENLYLTDRLSCKEAKKMTCDCFLTEEEIKRGGLGCGDDCLNRLLMIECGNLCQVGERCTNKKFQKAQFAPVEVFNADKKGLGLRAAANVPYGEFILEYVGEVLNADEFDKRAEVYSKDKNQHYYFMSLRADAVIDATMKGNISRFINHSCDPNAETQKWTVNGELRIGFFSTRTILAGEEITFDYRFQRYGKEAQRCYCEASTCRGWLGEEPDDDDDEEEDEEEAESVDGKAEKIDVKTEGKDINDDERKSCETQAERPKSELKAKVKKVHKRKPRKELFEDLDQLDEEIEMLMTTGLKNQAHTLKLSRLMLRAKEPAQKTKLLRALRRGELPCRRLFLDYHGLRLMHGYMTDAQHLACGDKKYESLRLEMLQTLAVLPIPNKTMLQDSKVLTTVEKWSSPLLGDSPVDSESNSPKTDQDPTESPADVTVKSEPPALLVCKLELPDSPIAETVAAVEDTDAIRRSVSMEEVKMEYSYFTHTRGKALAEEIINIFEDETYVASPKPRKEATTTKPIETKPPPQTNYEEEIVALALKLLEEWKNLTEVFRIPKMERIEQMKEHEREANKDYIAGLGLGVEQYAEKKNETRYRGLQRVRQQEGAGGSGCGGGGGGNNKKPSRFDDKSFAVSSFSKYKRRKLFALQVEQEEEERRKKQRELWKQHEKNCMLLGTDPRFTAPFDLSKGLQCIFNPQTGQWQNLALPTLYGNATPLLPPTAAMALPNTNMPPPQFPPVASYPYGAPAGLPPMQMPPSLPPSGIPGGLPPISSMPPVPGSLHQLSSMSPVIPTSVSQLQSLIPQRLSNMPPLPINPPPPLPPTPRSTNIPPPLPNMPPHPLQTNIPPPLPPLPTSLPPTPPMLSHQIQNGMQNMTPLQSPQIMMPMQPVMSGLLYQQEKTKDDHAVVRFMGPIPPPVKLPPKWKCAKDKYGRPYYYHVRVRKSQWEPPTLEQPLPPLEDESSESTTSETTSESSESSSEESESDEDIDDSKLLRTVRRQMEKQNKAASAGVVIKPPTPRESYEEEATFSSPESEKDDREDYLDDLPGPSTKPHVEHETSIDRRLKEQFHLVKDEKPAKKRKGSLVQEIIISPRTEDDKLQFKEDLKKYKENKEKLKKQKEVILMQTKKHLKEKRNRETAKAKLREMKYSNSEGARKIKETFRSTMATTVVSVLNSYRKSDCMEGRIVNTDDFKHLARKLTHFVMLKEMKHISAIEELVCTDNVKTKAREYIRKYMGKFGEIYHKRNDEPDHYY